MLNRAEFPEGAKVDYWDGKKFIKASVLSLSLNPIKNIVEYKLFYRTAGSSGKRNRNFITVQPFKIKQSKHFDLSK